MRKRLLSLLLAAMLIMGILPLGAFAGDQGPAFVGQGTKDSPYQIASADDLLALASAKYETKGLYFQQTADIDMDGASWLGIGTKAEPFCGSFDGNGKTIANLKGTSGLFQALSGSATLRDITMDNASVSGATPKGVLANQYAGSSAEEQLVIFSCTVKNSQFNATAANFVFGGILGSVSGSAGVSLQNCAVLNCSLASTKGEYTGGILGNCTASGDVQIQNCCVSGGKLQGYKYTGGIVGGNTSAKLNMRSCFTDTAIKGSFVMTMKPPTMRPTFFGGTGGLVGKASAGKVVDCYVAHDVVGGYHVGGAFGDITGTFQAERIFVTGDVESTYSLSSGVPTGGLIGNHISTAKLSNSVAMAEMLTHVSPSFGRVSGKSGGLANNYAFRRMRCNGEPWAVEDGDGTIHGADVSTQELQSIVFWADLGFDFDAVWQWNGSDTEGYPTLRGGAVSQSIAIPDDSLRVLTQPETVTVYPYDTEASYEVDVMGDWSTITYQWEILRGTDWVAIDSGKNESAAQSKVTVAVQYGEPHAQLRCVITEVSTGKSVTSEPATAVDFSQDEIPGLSGLTVYTAVSGDEVYALDKTFDTDAKHYEIHFPYNSSVTAYIQPQLEDEMASLYQWRYTPIDRDGIVQSGKAQTFAFNTRGGCSLSDYVTAQIDVVEKSRNRVVNRYTIALNRYPRVSGIQISGDAALTEELANGSEVCSAYLFGDTLTVTPTLAPDNASVTYNGRSYASGDTISISGAQIGDTIILTLNGPDKVAGYCEGTFAIQLIEPPKEGDPRFLKQEIGDAIYTKGDSDVVGALTVYASADSPVTYQWFRHTENSTDGGQAIPGATQSRYIPSAAEAGKTYYYCVATANDIRIFSKIACIQVYPVLTLDAELLTLGGPLEPLPGVGFEEDTGYYYPVNAADVTPMTMRYSTSVDGTDYADELKVTISWSGTGTKNGTTFTPDVSKKDTYYVSVSVYVSMGNQSVRWNSSKVYVHVQDPVDDAPWEGYGTKNNPWKIKTQDDLNLIYAFAGSYDNYLNLYFELRNDLTLTDEWHPLGFFRGTFDGGDHTLSFPKDSPALITSAQYATVKNLSIYCPYINGDGLVTEYKGNGTTGPNGACIDILNVTLKSGTVIKGSGFLCGVGGLTGTSGSRTVNIEGCTIEEGVKIGYDALKDEPSGKSHIGSFAGYFNGTVQNSVSYATVYGVDYVGGLLGDKCQSMGGFSVKNSAFCGAIIATGKYIGGIVGRGYFASDAPNSPCVVIQNCYVAASISGSDYIGGILGREPVLQAWDNGIGYIQNNHFYGTIEAAPDAQYVGGIVGYMYALNKYNVIANNYYLDTCGTNRGIGGVQYVDTSCTSHETASGAEYFDTSIKLPGIITNESFGGQGVTKRNHNRTDDPLGADRETLAKAVTAAQMKDGTVAAWLNNGGNSYKNWLNEGGDYPVHSSSPIALSLSLSGSYQTEYRLGEPFTTQGMVLTAVFSDGSESAIDPSEASFTGYDPNKTGYQTIIVSYSAAKLEFSVKVLPEETDKITVSFTLMGDTLHGTPDADSTHTLSDGNLQTWIVESAYELDAGATVYDLLMAACKEHGYSCVGAENNYVSSITTPDGLTLEEMDNGPLSGWMYTLNGVHPELGLREQMLENADNVVFHYTDDYTKESASLNPDSNPDPSPSEVTPEEAYKAVGDYISALGTPGVGSVGGEWMVIGLARSGRPVPAGYYDAVLKFVQENVNDKEQLHRAKSTENARVILALTALGKDVTDVAGHNLLMGLTDMDYVTTQGINGPIWALLAFDSHDYAIPSGGDVTREKLIDYILSRQLEDDGWALGGVTSDVDITAMAIQALAPYYKTNANVKAAVDKALAYLSSAQRSNGSFASGDGACSESCAQVIVALTALGLDPASDSRFIKNGHSVLEALTLFFVKEGGFRHTVSGALDGMATEQSYYALAAYFRMKDGETALYDMTDVTIGAAQPTEPNGETNNDKKGEDENKDNPETGNVNFPCVAASIGMLALGVLVIVYRKRMQTL